MLYRLSGEVLVAHLQASESHKKIERLSASLNKEKQSRVEAEEMLKARQKVFDIYALRYESKFRYGRNAFILSNLFLLTLQPMDACFLGICMR